ncbi:hypothetical protein [Ectopseudomonas khazarica]|uniref:hypothetical protein n=1 Tax=Ectopseudomonas khazarica TaxID=2502979 RepID=UPI00106ECA30|nr:hypothetical protein [Pseudomonas khazarica]
MSITIEDFIVAFGSDYIPLNDQGQTDQAQVDWAINAATGTADAYQAGDLICVAQRPGNELGYTHTVNVIGRYKLPVRPAGVMLNGWYSGNNVSKSSTYQIRWCRRSSDYRGILLDTDPLDVPEDGVTYNVRLKQGGITKAVSYGVDGNEIDMSGSLIPKGELLVEIEAVADAGNSIVTDVAKFNITA